MPCTYIRLPDGRAAIVCGSRPRLKNCSCGSGKVAVLLCDWKVGHGGKTCDAPMCPDCTQEVAPEKHLCVPHQREWRKHPLFRP